MGSGSSPSEAELERHAVELERRAERLKGRPDELERWSKIAGAWAAVFTAITAGGHFGHLPAAVAVTAGGFLLAGVVAALAFLLGANRAGQRAQIAQRDAEFARRAASQAAALLVPVGEIGAIDPIRVGVERVAMAMTNKGIALTKLERFDEAVAIYGDIVALFGDASEPRLRELVDRARVRRRAVLGNSSGTDVGHTYG